MVGGLVQAIFNGSLQPKLFYRSESIFSQLYFRWNMTELEKQPTKILRNFQKLCFIISLIENCILNIKNKNIQTPYKLDFPKHVPIFVQFKMKASGFKNTDKHGQNIKKLFTFQTLFKLFCCQGNCMRNSVSINLHLNDLIHCHQRKI